ncbi:MAG: hypothetical protein ABH829_00595 [archaeon]
MQTIIHLRAEEIGLFEPVLSRYPQKEFKESFIINRVEISECVVTLYSSGKLLIQGEGYLKVYDMLTASLPTQETAVGIDEAGRGEDFGSLVVAGVLGDRNKLRRVRDSKKTGDISAAYRIVMQNALDSHAVVVRSDEIDRLRTSGKNMDMIQAEAVREIMLRIGKGREVFIDGRAVKGIDANFLEKGDDLDPLISAASIIAKYTRDNSEKGKRETWGKKLSG